MTDNRPKTMQTDKNETSDLNNGSEESSLVTTLSPDEKSTVKNETHDSKGENFCSKLNSDEFREKMQKDDKEMCKLVRDEGIYNLMDEQNKSAMNAWENGGASAAVKYMMDSAGGDYARMRSMYG